MGTNLLPKLDFNARATYQSDVTAMTLDLPDDLPFDLGDISTPEISKDQYRLNVLPFRIQFTTADIPVR